MNLTKLFVIGSWIYLVIYVLIDLPMGAWYWRAIRGVCSIVCSFSLMLFIVTKIDQWQSRAKA